MICRKCNKKQAAFFLTRDDDGQGMKVGFCDACADEVGIFSALQKVESLLHGYGLSMPETGLLPDPAMPIEFAESCAVCGTDLRSFERDFHLGCDNCCHIFGSLLLNYVSLLTPSYADMRLKPLYPGLAPRPAKSRKVTPLTVLLRHEASAGKNPSPEKSAQKFLDKTDPPADAEPGLAPACAKDLSHLLSRCHLNPDPFNPWLQTRIEIRRNFADCIFPGRMSAAHRAAVMRHARDILAQGGPCARRMLDVWRLSPLQRVALERRHFDRCLSIDSSLVLSRNQDRMILINDEDHLSFITTNRETDPAKALQAARTDLARFERHTDFAYSPRFGYMTASPRNMGAALSVSVLIHLPFSLTQDQLQFYPSRAERAGVRFEPFCGRGLERHGFFRVSSIVPFNATEEQLATRVIGFAQYLVDEETKARENLPAGEAARLKRLMTQVLDHGRRSYRMSYQDALRFTSFLSLGGTLGAMNLEGFSLGKVVPALSSPFIMFRDKHRYTINECEQRRADLFADLIETWTNPLLQHPVDKNKKSRTPQ